MAAQQQGWTGYCEGAKTGYSHLAPKFATKTRQINQPLGKEKAKAIAKELGITKDMQLTKQEYKEFIGTKGTRRNNPNQAIIYNCVQNLSNSTGNPIKVDTDGDGKKDTDVVLGSYGLSVINENSEAYIQTDCFENSCGYIADCLAFNSLASGYLQRWSITHGTYDKWRAMIELPSFKELTIASTRCQDEYVDDNACVVPLENGAAETEYAGVPLTPTIWLINFMFLYKLNRKVAANMPGYAAKLPSSVADGMIEAQANDAFGLPYQDTIDLLPGVTTLNQTSKQKKRAEHQGDPIISPSNPAKARSSKRKNADSSAVEVMEALPTDAIAELASATSLDPSRESIDLGSDPHTDGSTLLEVIS